MFKRQDFSQPKLQIYNVQELKHNVCLEKEFVDKAKGLEKGDMSCFPGNYVDRIINKDNIFGKPFSPTAPKP